ncbi:uncharacterized protein CTRU02_201411 [Colletotrichum truncatum]|uniref:Uncharacterized protein n=1 Tax=Colletotrichum truncatum TaxID=5467 RepID=A0ACC3ZHG4_COLTU|nr:uncharacterized protein CTRU02_15469 [Colletotrichum truncatum]KAF6781001.1 hypothetical protein CTRU02_15469 [Colletotrichum truncatum]
MSHPSTGLRKASSKVRQACDRCHSRKIRCDGRRPCIKCQETEAECTFYAVPKKTGPKGPRHTRKLHHRQQPVPSSSYQRDGASPEREGYRFENIAQARTDGSPPRDTAHDSNGFRPAVQVSTDILQWCLNAFFKHKYPITPILCRPQMEECLQEFPTSPEKYGLLMACCAVIALSPEIFPPSAHHQINLPKADFFLSETLRSRRYHNFVDNLSLTHAQTSFFLFAAFFCIDNDNAAWFYLRESITILQTLRLHEEATYNDINDTVLVTYARRMFWVLFITERAYALQRNRPLTLQSTLNLPNADPLSSDAEILPGFLDLISLFRPFDTEFISTWNSSIPSASPTAAEPGELARLQNTLKHALPSVSNYSETQQADLLISRQWLKVIVWKLCVSKTLLSGTNSDDSMSLSYPSTIARDVVLITRRLPTKALEANGIGILEKVFDIGCSLADLLSLSPASTFWSAMDVGPIDILMETVKIVGRTFGGTYRHLDILVDKANYSLLMNVDRSLPLPVDVSLEEL